MPFSFDSSVKNAANGAAGMILYNAMFILKFDYKPDKNPRPKLEFMSFDADFFSLTIEF